MNISSVVRRLLRTRCPPFATAFACLAFLLANSPFAHAQGPLANGVTHHGVISDPRETNYWSFTAAAGDSVVLRMGSFTLNPRV
jgi:hypothetical protein